MTRWTTFGARPLFERNAYSFLFTSFLKRKNFKNTWWGHFSPCQDSVAQTLAFSHAGGAGPCSAYQACKMIKSIIHVIFRPHDRAHRAGSDFKESVIKSLGISHAGEADPFRGQGLRRWTTFWARPLFERNAYSFLFTSFLKRKIFKNT